MWEEFGNLEVGFTEERLKSIVESVAGADLTEFYDLYIHGVDELPFNRYLIPFGVELQSVISTIPYLGIAVNRDGGREVIKSVISNSPADLAGIDPGDELLAIDGFKVSPDRLNELLQNYRAGQEIYLTIFHGDLLRTIPVTLGQPEPQQYQLHLLDHPAALQSQQFKAWVGEVKVG
jgi:predicted metalloprotease with PDZ domain